MDALQVSIRESTGPLLAQHRKLMDAIAGPIDYGALDRASFEPRALELAVAGWRRRLADEYRSATLFSQFQSLLLLANVPVDVLGCASRVVQDEVRHVQLCADIVRALGGEPDTAIDASVLYLAVDPTAPVAPQLISLTIGLFCLGETASAALIGATREATREPVVREVLARLHRDEVFHAEFGWHLLGLLLQAPDAPDREAIGATLAGALAQLERLCTTYGPEAEAMAFGEDDRRLGSLSVQEHRATFYEAVERDLLPRFEKLGLPARAAWEARR